MTGIEQVLNYVKNITETLNQWAANAKKTEELPVMVTMDPEGLLIVSQLVDGIWTSKQLEIQKIIEGISLSGQDNTVREVLLGTITTVQDLNYLLDNTGITVTENEIIVLTALANVNATLIQRQFLWKLGKGAYNPIGSENSNTKLFELQPRFLSEITADELTSSPSAIVYDFGVITDSILDVINTTDPAYNFTDDEKIYYIRFIKDEVKLLYNFIGINDTYGFGASQMTAADLVLVYSSANTDITELFVTKIESQDYLINYFDAVVEEVYLSDERASLSFIGSNTDIKSIRLSEEFMRLGKLFTFKNRQTIPVTFWHNSGTGNVKMLFPSEENFVLKPNEIIQFSLNLNDSSTPRLEYIGVAGSGGGVELPIAITDVTGLTEELADKALTSYVDSQDTAKLVEAKAYSDGLITQLIDGAPADANTLKELNDKILAVQAIIGGTTADGDALVNTVAELLAVFATFPEGVDLVTLLAGKVNTTDVYNALDCIVAGKVADARQLKVLNDLIVALTTVVAGKEDTSNKSNDIEADKTSTTKYSSVKQLYDWAVAKFQAVLVSGTNIKTINGTSILGSGDIAISGGGGGDMTTTTDQTVSGIKTFLSGKIGFRNVANTFTSFFTNANTASRTYTFPDISGMLALIASPTFTGIVGLPASVSMGGNAKIWWGDDNHRIQYLGGNVMEIREYGTLRLNAAIIQFLGAIDMSTVSIVCTSLTSKNGVNDYITKVISQHGNAVGQVSSIAKFYNEASNLGVLINADTNTNQTVIGVEVGDLNIVIPIGSIYRFKRSTGVSYYGKPITSNQSNDIAIFDVNDNFKAKGYDLSLLGSYANDAAAATGGVAVGFGYINSSTGAMHRRLT